MTDEVWKNFKYNEEQVRRIIARDKSIGKEEAEFIHAMVKGWTTIWENWDDDKWKEVEKMAREIKERSPRFCNEAEPNLTNLI